MFTGLQECSGECNSRGAGAGGEGGRGACNWRGAGRRKDRARVRRDNKTRAHLRRRVTPGNAHVTSRELPAHGRRQCRAGEYMLSKPTLGVGHPQNCQRTSVQDRRLGRACAKRRLPQDHQHDSKACNKAASGRKEPTRRPLLYVCFQIAR